MVKREGMLPGEYMKVGHVKVWPKGLEGKVTVDGLERRPEIYLVTVRKLDGEFQVEVMKGQPIKDGLLPNDVFKRTMSYHNLINKEERSDKAKQAAADRKADRQVETPQERRNGFHVVKDGNGFARRPVG